MDYKDFTKEEWLKIRPNTSLILADTDTVRLYKNGFMDVLK